MATYCKACGSGDVMVSRSRTKECFYCPDCGIDWQSERDLPKEEWVDKKVAMNQKKVQQLRNR